MSREEVERRASDVFRSHGLETIPVDPVLLANREGITVYNAKFADDNLLGMIVKRGGDVKMLVNHCDPPFRKRFTIAHELGHHFLHLMTDGQLEQIFDHQDAGVRFRKATAGLGLLLATQSPGDLDYRCRDNIRTWLVGRVQQSTALARMRPMPAECRVDIESRLPGQGTGTGTGEFYLLRDGTASGVLAGRSALPAVQRPEDQIEVLARPPAPGDIVAADPRCFGTTC